MAYVPIENGEKRQLLHARLSQSLSLAQREVVKSDNEKGLVGIVNTSPTNVTQQMAFFDKLPWKTNNKRRVSIDCIEWSSLLPRRLLAIQHPARQDRICPWINDFYAFVQSQKCP